VIYNIRIKSAKGHTLLVNDVIVDKQVAKMTSQSPIRAGLNAEPFKVCMTGYDCAAAAVVTLSSYTGYHFTGYWITAANSSHYIFKLLINQRWPSNAVFFEHF
jgi:hypothetical protein